MYLIKDRLSLLVLLSDKFLKSSVFKSVIYIICRHFIFNNNINQHDFFINVCKYLLKQIIEKTIRLILLTS